LDEKGEAQATTTAGEEDAQQKVSQILSWKLNKKKKEKAQIEQNRINFLSKFFGFEEDKPLTASAALMEKFCEQKATSADAKPSEEDETRAMRMMRDLVEEKRDHDVDKPDPLSEMRRKRHVEQQVARIKELQLQAASTASEAAGDSSTQEADHQTDKDIKRAATLNHRGLHRQQHVGFSHHLDSTSNWRFRKYCSNFFGNHPGVVENIKSPSLNAENAGPF
ncbi:unnamed protein product, partial [Amoebophrya sp. A25]